ncbi:hypothetical protein [Promicromonospora umidemergens]|uniref:hypothetical protein n=1 Tax=Promicromonospora umidemergens TaxID=629679 RepID=UPI0020A26035|nr:hypothetical protein [Promicromonospora umidemergens]
MRNPSSWPVTVISTDLDVHRLQPVPDEQRDDIMFAARPADGGVPDGTQSAVVIPPGGALRGRYSSDRLGTALQEACEA